MTDDDVPNVTHIDSSYVAQRLTLFSTHNVGRIDESHALDQRHQFE